ncbi:MAG: hypothetical protein LAT68_02445 [Cyclobacteriaceae bacterium]|nr:hypothetical protein [Cyclobacteriaceae bacterium]MCH8515164.1 hypothetical protein [Cyclobacteriaceae bacterium]
MKIKILILTVILFMTNILDVLAQCAMCRTQLENNVSEGNIGIAAGINTGILYLFFTPYILAGIIIYFWYKNSKKNAQKIKVNSYSDS